MVLQRLNRLHWYLAGFLLLGILLNARPLHAQQDTTDAPADNAGPNDGPLQKNTDFSRTHPLDNDTIIRMAKAGLSEEVILNTIRTQPGRYDTMPDDLIALKTAGVTDKVILNMQTYNLPKPAHKRTPGLQSRTGPPPSMNVDIATPETTSAIASGVDELGVYYKSPNGQWIELKTERVTQRSGGTIKNILSDGYIRRDMNGHIQGPKSPLVLPSGVEILIYSLEGTAAEEYDLLRFREHSDNREFRTLTGGILHSQSGADRDEIEFHAKKIGPQMYTFTVPKDIEKGEYGVLPPASAGVEGSSKIYTFSIRE